MQFSVTCTPVAVEDFEFVDLKGKTVNGTRITFKEDETQEMFEVNTQDKDFVKICTEQMYKSMKEVPFALVKVNKTSWFKLKFVK